MVPTWKGCHGDYKETVVGWHSRPAASGRCAAVTSVNGASGMWHVALAGCTAYGVCLEVANCPHEVGDRSPSWPDGSITRAPRAGLCPSVSMSQSTSHRALASGVSNCPRVAFTGTQNRNCRLKTFVHRRCPERCPGVAAAPGRRQALSRAVIRPDPACATPCDAGCGRVAASSTPV